MATITTKVCDRCGQPMKCVGWTAKLEKAFRKGKKIKITEYLNGNLDGYSYSKHCYELCEDCTKKLERFLNG